MERVLKKEIVYKVDSCDKCLDELIINKILSWLEKEDSDFDKVLSYGLCLTAFTYFWARLLL